VLSLTDTQKAEVIRDAYKKHAEELRAIEDAQTKLTGVMLGIFGAGASFLASTKNPIPAQAKVGLTIVIAGIIGVGTIIAWFRRGARRGTRDLLKRCEQALGFFENDFYISGEKLYGDVFQNFPKKGWWLDLAIILAGVSGLGFLLLLWSLQ
jgi:hypothetical protein